MIKLDWQMVVCFYVGAAVIAAAAAFGLSWLIVEVADLFKRRFF